MSAKICFAEMGLEADSAPGLNSGRMSRKEKREKNRVADAIRDYAVLKLGFHRTYDGSIPHGAIGAVSKAIKMPPEKIKGNKLTKWKNKGKCQPCRTDAEMDAVFRLAEGAGVDPHALLTGK